MFCPRTPFFFTALLAAQVCSIHYAAAQDLSSPIEAPTLRFAERIAQQPSPQNVDGPAAPEESKSETEPTTPEESKSETPPNSETTETADQNQNLAKAAQNPVANMISVPFQFNTNFGVGPQRATAELVNIQPVIPMALDEDWNLINRAILPLQYLPVEALVPSGTPLPGGPELGLGDVNYTGFISPSQPGRLIWGVGPTVTLPTATSTRFGSGKLSLGASAVGLTVDGPWVVGALVSQQWSVAGDASRDSVSTLLVQPFVNYNMPGGWYLTSSPIVTANWMAPADQRWTVPVGGGLGRVFKMGDQPVNLSLAAFANVIRPDNGPTWSLRFQFQLLFPTKP